MMSQSSFQIHEPECDIQYQWAGLDLGAVISTRDGQIIHIESTGTYNKGPGPDFLNARIRINNEVRVGDIEIHTREADWFMHKHHLDSRYQNVILHVIRQSSSRQLRIETVVLEEDHPTRLPPLPDEYESRCATIIENTSDETLNKILEQSGIERFKFKTEKIAFSFLKYGKESTARQLLFDTMGYPNNRTSFMTLFKRYEHAMHAFAHPNIETLIWGESNLLPDPAMCEDVHEDLKALLQKIWHDFGSHRTQSYSPILWNRVGARPANSPERRTAALIELLGRMNNMPLTAWKKSIVHLTTPKDIIQHLVKSLCDIEGTFSQYWNWKKKTSSPIALIGKARAHDILVNAILPTLYADTLIQKETTRAELFIQCYLLINSSQENHVLKQAFINCFGKVHRHRAERLTSKIANQQGLIHLYLNFCEQQQSDCRHCKLIEHQNEKISFQ